MRFRHLAIGIVTVLALGACTDEKIVYRDRPAFNPPPDSLNGFLGYFTISTKQTSCGNCHVGVQGQWKATRHAGAWADLQRSGHAVASCPCGEGQGQVAVLLGVSHAGRRATNGGARAGHPALPGLSRHSHRAPGGAR